MYRSFNIPAQTVLVFLLLLSVGFWLAAKKPLWNDEVYSQVNSVQKLSFTQILAGQVPEGNGCPLFYLVQKSINNIAGYSLPVPWDRKGALDAKSRLILRIAPNICMSLGLALIFYFFAEGYGWWWGIYGLMLSLSSFMVWAYWAEARPYALWFLLTTLQLLVFIKLLTDKKREGLWSSRLVIIHFLLSFTVIFSVIQIAVVLVLLWKKPGHIDFLKIKSQCVPVFFSLLPIAIGLFYKAQAPRYVFWSDKSWWDLINLNLPADILWIAAIYAVFMLFYRTKAMPRPAEGRALLLLMGLLFFAAVALIIGMTHGHQPPQGFELSMRYFIFLVPLGIISALVFARGMAEAFKKDWWLLTMLAMVLGSLLVIRLLQGYILILGLYAF